ncbi:MAG: hypothetical protein GEV13_10700 [Rhodospirillales bacterium]|nr:hypothetical protein [Rhodospirillales bacterium]
MRPLGVATLQLEVVTEISPEIADLVVRAVATYPNHHVEIAIDTIGGDWAASLAIYTALANHKRRVTAHCVKAASSGALIAMSADIRHLDPAGHFFLHMPSGPTATSAQLDKIADAKAAMMASRCRIPAKRIRLWMEKNTFIPAQRALQYGLVDAVPGLVKPELPVVFL